MRAAIRSLLTITLVVLPLAAAEPESVEIESTDGIRLYGEVYEAEDPRAVILLFHQGGGSSRGEHPPIASRLVDEGYTAIAFDLRAGGNVFKVDNRAAAQLND